MATCGASRARSGVLADVRLAAGQLALRELHLHVREHVVHGAPRGARGPHRRDRVVHRHRRVRDVAVDVGPVRLGVIAVQRARVVERRLLHRERIEHERLHRLVVGGAELELRIRDVAADEPAAAAIRFEYWNISPNFDVGCIVASTAIAFSGVSALEVEDHSRSWRGRPVHAQIRCLTSTCLRDVVGAEPERRQQARHERVPAELAVVDELREHQRRQLLRVRRDHELGVGVDLEIRLREVAQADAAREDDLAVLHDAVADAGDAHLRLGVRDERRDLTRAVRRRGRAPACRRTTRAPCRAATACCRSRRAGRRASRRRRPRDWRARPSTCRSRTSHSR